MNDQSDTEYNAQQRHADSLSSQPQSPPAGDTELIQGILGMGAMAAGDLAAMEDCELAAKAQLSAYILAQVKELVGPHISLTEEEIKGGRIYRIGDPQGDAVDRYKDELVKAAQARFGAEEGKHNA